MNVVLNFITAFLNVVVQVTVSLGKLLDEIYQFCIRTAGPGIGDILGIVVISMIFVLIAFIICRITSLLGRNFVTKLARTLIIFLFTFCLYVLAQFSTGLANFFGNLSADFIASFILIVALQSLRVEKQEVRRVVIAAFIFVPALLLVFGAISPQANALLIELRPTLLSAVLLFIMSQLWITGKTTIVEQ